MFFVNAKPRFTPFFIFILLFFSVLVRAESAAQEPLLVNSEFDYPPYTTVDANGQPEGFAVDLLNAIAEAEGLELQWGVDLWNKNFTLLQSGNIALLPMMAQSSEREQKFLFSDIFMRTNDAIFVRRGDDLITSLADVLNHTVIVVRNDFAHEYFRDYIDHERLRIVETVGEGMTILAAGEARIMIMARLTGLQAIRELSLDNVETLAVPVDWYSRDYSIAVSKLRPELLAPLNRGLAKVRADGTYEKLFEKWIASADKVAIRYASSYKVLYIILGTLVVLMLLATVFIFSLKRMVLVKITELSEEREERYQIEKVVSQNEGLFRGAFESTMQGMALLSLDGDWLRVNQALCDMEGVFPSEMIGGNIKTTLHEEDQKEFTFRAQSMLTGARESFSMELQPLSHNEKKWIRIYFYLITNEENRGEYIYAQIQDISANKNSEKKLNNALYDLKFAQNVINIHAIVSRTDSRGIITHANDKFCTVSQYSSAELIGSDHRLVKSGLHSKDFYNNLWETISSGEVWEGEICNRRKDNSLYWVFTTIVPHIGIEGKPDSFHSVRTDITEQKKTEELIRSEREFFHTTIENLKDGIVVIDNNGKVQLVNVAAKNYLSTPKGILQCRTSETCLQTCKLHSIINDALAGVMLDDVPMTLPSTDKGDLHDFLVAGRPIIDKNGVQVGCLVSLHDVTAKLAAEKKVVDFNFLFNAIFDNDAIAIGTSDDSYNILNVNTAFETMLGYSEAELQKLGLKGITHPDDIKESYEAYLAFFSGAFDSYQIEKRYIHKNGTLVWARVTAFNVKNDGGRHMVIMVADITNEKFMEGDRRRLQRQLVQAEKMEAIGALTGGIAHDFNNILASILGYTDLALMRFCPDPESKLKQYLTEVYKAGERARNLIAQMMDFSRAGGGSRSNLAMELTVKETLKMMVPTLPSSIQIDFQCKEKDLPQISIDPVRLHQVVMNLVINARDAIEGKGKISISVKYYRGKPTECLSCHDIIDGEYVELCVSDSGVGMSSAELEQVFNPFYTTKDVGKGTGMGLSVIHGIVHEYDGHILVESKVGEGSNFRILFEAVAPLDVEIEEQRMDTPALPQLAKHVMVVDDEPMIREYLKELLTSVGHQVSTYSDSNNALADFNKSPYHFDVVITDQTMPGMLGVELIAAMKAVRPELSVILCTGYTELNVQDALKGFDLIQFMKKPVDRQELLTMIIEEDVNE